MKCTGIKEVTTTTTKIINFVEQLLIDTATVTTFFPPLSTVTTHVKKIITSKQLE